MARRQANEEPMNAQQQAAIMTQTAAVLAGVRDNMNLMLQQLQQNQNANAGGQGIRGLDEFCRRNPKEFAGGYASEEAEAWIASLERIFGGMGQCSDEQKVAYAGYMMVGEAADWWRNERQALVGEAGVITWNQFKNRLLEKYFPEHLKTAKEMEFLRLEQGNMSVGEYAAKFENLARFMPYYGEAGNERSKCAKFLDGLKPEIKQALAPLEINVFTTLVNKGSIVENGLKSRNLTGKSAAQASSGGPMRHSPGNGNQNSGAGHQGPYGQGSGQRDNRFGGNNSAGSNNRSGGNRNRHGNDRNNNRNNQNNGGNRGNNGNASGNNGDAVGGQVTAPALCNKCNKNHYGPNCPYENPNCFNCNKPGHISKNCREPKREMGSDRPKGNGRVFAMVGNEDANAASRY